MIDKEYISYEDFERDCYKLSCALKNSSMRVKRLVAVTRGGMVPTCLISQWLDVREIHSIALETYKKEGVLSDVVAHGLPAVLDAPDTVFIDDLYDTGKTHDFIRTHFPHSRIGVVYTKQKKELDFPAVKKEAGAWIVFPWEK